MAEKEIKINVVAEGSTEAKNELQGLKDTLDETANSNENLASSTSTATAAIDKQKESAIAAILKHQEFREIAAGVGNAFANLGASISAATQITNRNQREAALAASAWTATKDILMSINPAIGSAVTALDTMITAYDDWIEAEQRLELQHERTLNLFEREFGSEEHFTRTQEAVGNLVDQFELMNIALEASRNGLRLTDSEFLKIVQSAQEFSNRTGTDLLQSIQTLTNALATGNNQALQQFNISLREGETASQALSRTLEQQSNTIEQNRELLLQRGRTQEEINIAIRASQMRFEELTEAERHYLAIVQGNNDAINRQTQAIRERNQAMDESANSIIRMVEAAANSSVAPTLGLGSTMHIPGTLGEEQPTQQRSGGGGSSGPTPEELSRQALELEEQWRRNEEARQALLQAENQNRIDRQTAELNLLNIEKERIAIAQENNVASEQRLRNLERESQLANERFNAEREKQLSTAEGLRANALADINSNVEKYNNFQQKSLELGSMLANNNEKERKKAIKNWLKDFSIKEAFTGGSDLATAIGYSMNPLTANLAAEKYASAAKHFAMAAAAGGAAGGLAMSGKGGGNGGGSSQASGIKENKIASGGMSETPQTITININGQSLLTEGQIGREINNALTAYKTGY